MSTQATSSWTRRAWLKGAALGMGGAALLPLADRLVHEARGAQGMPRRIVFVIEGNGWYAPYPETSGTNITALSSSMTALTPYQDQIAIAAGLELRDGRGHTHGYTGLSCVPNVGSNEHGAPGAATIDQEIAAGLASTYPWKSLHFAANKSLSVDKSNLAAGRLVPVASFGHPVAAYASTLGLASNDPAAVAGRLRRMRLFDSLRHDIGQIEGQLAGPEREKFQRSVDEFARFEERIMYMQDHGVEINECGAQIPGLDPGLILPPDSVEARSVGFFELAAHAIICGLTPVVTILASSGDSFGSAYHGLGFSLGKHALGHGGTDPVAGKQDTIHNFYAGLIAQLCDRLAAVPEGDGTVLDNTVIVWLNENGTAHHSRPHHPYVGVVIGGSNLGLRLGGRYHDFEFGRSWADFLNTMAHAVGVPRDDFGTEGSTPVVGPLEPLLS